MKDNKKTNTVKLSFNGICFRTIDALRNSVFHQRIGGAQQRTFAVFPTARKVEVFGTYRFGVVYGGEVVRSHKVAERGCNCYAHSVLALANHVGNVGCSIEQQRFGFAVYFDFGGLPPASEFEHSLFTEFDFLFQSEFARESRITVRYKRG